MLLGSCRTTLIAPPRGYVCHRPDLSPSLRSPPARGAFGIAAHELIAQPHELLVAPELPQLRHLVQEVDGDDYAIGIGEKLRDAEGRAAERLLAERLDGEAADREGA